MNIILLAPIIYCLFLPSIMSILNSGGESFGSANHDNGILVVADIGGQDASGNQTTFNKSPFSFLLDPEKNIEFLAGIAGIISLVLYVIDRRGKRDRTKKQEKIIKAGILVPKLSSVLKKVKEIEIIPQKVSPSVILDGTTTSAKEVSKNEMEEIYTELRRDTTKNRKQATITKLRSYSDSKRIWKHSVTWEIISYLLDSYTMDGLYVIEYMIKFCQKEYPDDLNSLIDNIKVFLPRLLNLIQPGVDDRISGDSFRILTMIVEENTLSKYALSALSTAINELNDAEYTGYIRKYVLYFERASKKNQEDLRDSMYDLTSKEGKVGTRARHLYEYFLKR